MDANTTIDLDQLHQSIVDSIAAQFPALKTVEDYYQNRKSLALPACLVELYDMEPDPSIDPGTGQLSVNAGFSAKIIIGFKTANAKREIRKLAASIAAFIQHKRWGLPVGPAMVTSISPDDFEPELDQFEVFSIEWQQVVHLGDSVWSNAGADPIPTVVLASWSPDTGLSHEQDYVDIDDGAP